MPPSPPYPMQCSRRIRPTINRQSALADLVASQFAILKVGPELTFAYREAVFAMAAMEQQLPRAIDSDVISCIDAVMNADDKQLARLCAGRRAAAPAQALRFQRPRALLLARSADCQRRCSAAIKYRSCARAAWAGRTICRDRHSRTMAGRCRSASSITRLAPSFANTLRPADHPLCCSNQAEKALLSNGSVVSLSKVGKTGRGFARPASAISSGT